MDKKAFYKLSYGLHIISTTFEGKDSGCVANTLIQVTADPPKVSVALNKDNFTEQQIEKSGVFTGVALTQDADIKLIGTFGFRTSQDTDKFANYPTARDENGVAYIAESTAARFSCKLVDTLDVGTHVILVGDVMDTEVLSDTDPMTYDYYHKIVKGKTPENAPSYQKPD